MIFSCVHQDKQETGMKVTPTALERVSQVLYWFISEDALLLEEKLKWTKVTTLPKILYEFGFIKRFSNDLVSKCFSTQVSIHPFTYMQSVQFFFVKKLSVVQFDC